VYVRQHEESFMNFAEIALCTEFDTTKFAPDSAKFYCRPLVKLGPRDSKLIKLNCQYKFS